MALQLVGSSSPHTWCYRCGALVVARFEPYRRLCKGVRRFTGDVDALVWDGCGFEAQRSHRECPAYMWYGPLGMPTCLAHRHTRVDVQLRVRVAAFRRTVARLPTAVRSYLEHDSGFTLLGRSRVLSTLPLHELAVQSAAADYALHETMDLARLLLLQLCLLRRCAGTLPVDLLEELRAELRVDTAARRARVLMRSRDAAAAPPKRLRQHGPE